MGWVAIPETFQDDPRLIELGHEARSRLVQLWCFCGKHENDGRLSRAVAESICPPAIIEALKTSRFIEERMGALELVDFLKHNVAHEQRDHHREKAAERKARWLNRVRNAVPDAVQNDARPGPGPGPGPGPERNGEEAASPPPVAPLPATPLKARRESKTHPRRGEIIAILDRIYFEATEQKPDWTLAKNRGIADSLARRWEPSEVEIRARRFWIDHLPGFVWSGKATVCSLADFWAHFERLAVQSRSASSTRSESFWPAFPSAQEA